MKRLLQIAFLVIAVQAVVVYFVYTYQNLKSVSNIFILQEEYSTPKTAYIDHTRFAELQKDFKNPQDVTAACLQCHTERGEELLSSHHFLWERAEYIPDRGVVYLGKKNAINNWCTSALTNEQTCNRCHAGFEWDVNTNHYDYSDPKRIDCLICHDNSFTYSRVRGNAEHPDFIAGADDYDKVFRNLASPKRENCGICHFLGGGGNNIKHGDLELALLWADRDMDVHMSRQSANLSCVDCHETNNHKMKGRYYGGLATSNTNRASCTDCHGDFPHPKNQLNKHSIKVSCQACHIPVFAKENATVTHWDWRTMGKLEDGEPLEIKDEDGNYTYLSIKGSFVWEKNIEPQYMWFNGTANQHLMTDKIADTPLQMNTLYGSYRDRNSKIVPVKINTGYQPYDVVNNTLAHMKLYDHEKGKGGFWVDFDLEKSLQTGMDYLEMPYSGEYDFIETVSHGLINHMVAPKESALSCTDCHTRENSRLAGLTDFYMPGRDHNKWISGIGKFIVFFSVFGVFIHLILRIIFKKFIS